MNTTPQLLTREQAAVFVGYPSGDTAMASLSRKPITWTDGKCASDDPELLKLRDAVAGLGAEVFATVSTLERMKASPRWLLWRLEVEDGRTLKVPYYTSGVKRHGKPDSPEDMGRMATYEDACSAVIAGGFTGLGFALGPDETGNCWQGIDLDHLSEHPENADLVESLPGYREQSPSGDGLHFIGYGAPFPSIKRDKAGIEAYSAGRYFTFTGTNGRDAPLVDLCGAVATLSTRLKVKAPQAATTPTSAPTGSAKCDLLELAGILSRINPAKLDYGGSDAATGVIGWFGVICGVHHEFNGTPMRDAAINTLEYWSAKDTKRYKPGEVAKKWDTIKGDGPNLLTMEHVRLCAGLPRGDLPAFPKVTIPDDDSTFDPPEEAQRGVQPPFPDPFPGAMTELFLAAMQASNKEQPELMTAAILTGMAASIDGRHWFGRGTRCNLFTIGVAGTGEGKEWTRTVGETLTAAAGGRVIGKPGSGEGLEDEMTDYCNLLTSVDEAGFTFAPPERTPAHLMSLKRLLLQAYSVSGTVYHGRSKSGAPGRDISHPCISVCGFTTPETLGANMTSMDIVSGELPRYLMVFGRDNAKLRRVTQRFEMPLSVLIRAKEIGDKGRVRTGDGAPPVNYQINLSPQGDKALDEALAYFEGLPRDKPFAGALYTRSYEKAERIASVLAVWTNPSLPVITAEMVQWAVNFVTYSNWSLIEFAETHMVGAKSIADAKTIMPLIKRIVEGGFTPRTVRDVAIVRDGKAPWSMALKASKLSAKDFAISVDYLVQIGEVDVMEDRQTIGGTDATRVVRKIALRGTKGKP